MNEHPTTAVPSIGRIVIYHGHDGRDHPAVILDVLSGEAVNLTAFGPGAIDYLSVRRGDGIGEWQWPARV